MTITPARPPAWEPLEAALHHRRPLRLSYHGRQRLISPHALGWKHGRPMLLAYQTDPAVPPANPRQQWRCIYIDEIDTINTADPASVWATADNYNPTRPFPAIDHVTIAITPNGTNHAS
jgi:predicted DNA-binding transcriptional regulator YafY